MTFTCFKCGRAATPKMVFTATADAVQWVQIYGVTKPTDANDDDNGPENYVLKLHVIVQRMHLCIHSGHADVVRECCQE